MVVINHRLKAGEIDIVAQDVETMVFVEVRTRRGTSLGTPEESITPKKANRLVSLAYQYLLLLAVQPSSWRIDVIAIEVGRDGRVARFAHLKNVVGDGGFAALTRSLEALSLDLHG